MSAHLKTSGETLEYKKDVVAAHQELSKECKQVFEELKIRKKHRYLIYKMGETEFEIDHIGGRTEVRFQYYYRYISHIICRFRADFRWVQA